MYAFMDACVVIFACLNEETSISGLDNCDVQLTCAYIRHLFYLSVVYFLVMSVVYLLVMGGVGWGVVWHGAVWCGVVCSGLVRSGLVCCAVVWCGVRCAAVHLFLRTCTNDKIDMAIYIYIW